MKEICLKGEKISLYSCLVNAMRSKIISNSEYFPESDVVSVGRNLPTFRRCVLLPSSGHKSSRHSFNMFNALKQEIKNGQLLRRSEFLHHWLLYDKGHSKTNFNLETSQRRNLIWVPFFAKIKTVTNFHIKNTNRLTVYTRHSISQWMQRH
jgi:hypothetical protein